MAQTAKIHFSLSKGMSDVRCCMGSTATSLACPSLKDRVHVGCGGMLSQGSGEKADPLQAVPLLQGRWVAF